MNNQKESQAQTLCKSCGLCCSGHLFAWVRLNANELDRVENLGLRVIRDDPRQRGFLQPCPVWQGGICTVYASPDYPGSCGKYKCKVLRQLLDEEIALPNAMDQIQETLSLIAEVELLFPNRSSLSFRERLLAHKESLDALNESHLGDTDKAFLRKANELLGQYVDRFGVDDFIDYDD